MTYAFMTSMDERYHDTYGKAMLKSYKLKQNNKIPLYIYNEFFEPKLSDGMVLQGWDLGEEYFNFLDRWDNKRVKIFARKGFSIIHAMNNIPCKKLIWLDADTVIKEEIPKQFLDLIAPDNVLSTHFGVQHSTDEGHFFSCETGFFILNKEHSMFPEFKKTYTEIYHKDKKDGMRRFYDGEIYGKTIKQMIAKGAEVMDLNPDSKYKTPIPKSIISPYIQHNKGGLKRRRDYDKLTEDILE